MHRRPGPARPGRGGPAVVGKPGRAGRRRARAGPALRGRRQQGHREPRARQGWAAPAVRAEVVFPRPGPARAAISAPVRGPGEARRAGLPATRDRAAPTVALAARTGGPAAQTGGRARLVDQEGVPAGRGPGPRDGVAHKQAAETATTKRGPGRRAAFPGAGIDLVARMGAGERAKAGGTDRGAERGAARGDPTAAGLRRRVPRRDRNGDVR